VCGRRSAGRRRRLGDPADQLHRHKTFVSPARNGRSRSPARGRFRPAARVFEVLSTGRMVRVGQRRQLRRCRRCRAVERVRD
jgi:hypothetical protein